MRTWRQVESAPALLPRPLHHPRGRQRPHGRLQHRGQGGARVGCGGQLQRGLRGEEGVRSFMIMLNDDVGYIVIHPIKSKANSYSDISCQNGTWSSVPSCVPARCKTIPSPPSNGMIVVADTNHGSVGLFQCRGDHCRAPGQELINVCFYYSRWLRSGWCCQDRVSFWLLDWSNTDMPGTALSPSSH